MDKNIEVYLKDKNILNIMNKVSFPYKNNIDYNEIDSIKMDVLWNCINKYDKNRGSKFTSYLYQQLSFAFRSKVKKKKKEFPTCSIMLENNTICHKTQSDMNYYDILEGLPIDVSCIIKQRFLENMTMKEIGSANGYSRETARRKLLKAVKICKEKNKIQI
tara:strand:- start:894 stop:1376 length:483 start_codon:yes stop_codon:yes gene_type:complete